MSCFLNVDLIGITGDCLNTNVGAFDISITGSAPSYLINWISPYSGTSVPVTTGYTLSGLSAGTYQFQVIDSCVPINTIVPISINISSGTCVTLTGVQDTVCNEDNGSLTATTSNFYNISEFYLYENTSGFVTSGSGNDYSFVFTNLSAGTYYVIANDGGGCTGKTESCIIKSSTTLDFGFYIINNSACAFDSGAIYITGLTGNPPYTYSWSNGQVTSFITGLTDGFYTVNVTDGTGCVQSKGYNITSVIDFGIGTFTAVNPTCFNSDGEITVIVTGGTAPYYYSGSNGAVEVTFSTSKTFTGVSAGFFSVSVTDAGLCKVFGTTILNTPNSFSTVLVSTVNSQCNNNNGAINFTFLGGSSPYIYTLTDSLSNTQTITDVNPGTFKSYSFNNLPSGNYVLTISDGGPCVFSQSVTISNTSLYTLTTSTTGTTCDNDNGSVTLNITTGGTAPYKYEIEGSIINGVTGYTYTFNNLPAGNYTASVTDANLCQQSVGFVISASNTVDFYLTSTNVNNGNDGEITAFITDGEPPFTLNWSSNVNGQTGTTVTGLTAGTYTLSVTDDNGCVRLRTATLIGYNKITSFELFTICENTLSSDGTLIRRGMEQMLVEGFYDLTSGDTNCILNQASFYLETNLNGDIKGIGVYVSSGITDFPSDEYFYNTLKFVLETYDGIDLASINAVDNTLSVNTVCNPSISLIDANLTVSLSVSYDISCVSCSP
jgi:hypothetical protein